MFCKQNSYTMDSKIVPRRIQTKAGPMQKLISKREILRPYFDNEFSEGHSSRIALNIDRYIKAVKKFQRETPYFVEAILSRIYFLHTYNVKVAEVTFKYPITSNLTQLLLRYIVLESSVLYKKEYHSFNYGAKVEERILKLLHHIYNAHFEKLNVPVDKLLGERCKAILQLIIKVKTEFEVSNDLMENIAKKLLIKMGQLEQVNMLQEKCMSGPIDTCLHDPEFVKSYNNIITSDYGTNDDSKDEKENRQADAQNDGTIEEEDIKQDIKALLRVSMSQEDLLYDTVKRVPTIYIDDEDNDDIHVFEEEIKPSDKSERRHRLEEERKFLCREKQNEMFSFHKPKIDDRKPYMKEEVIDLDSEDEPNLVEGRCNNNIKALRKPSALNEVIVIDDEPEIIYKSYSPQLNENKSSEEDILLLNSDEDESLNVIPKEIEEELLKEVNNSVDIVPNKDVLEKSMSHFQRNKVVEDSLIVDELLSSTNNKMPIKEIIPADISLTNIESSTSYFTDVEINLSSLSEEFDSLKVASETNINAVDRQPISENVKSQTLEKALETCEKIGSCVENKNFEGANLKFVEVASIIADQVISNKTDNVTTKEIIQTDISLSDTESSSERKTEAVKEPILENVETVMLEEYPEGCMEKINCTKESNLEVQDPKIVEDASMRNRTDSVFIEETVQSIPLITNHEVTDNLFLKSQDFPFKEIFQIGTSVDSVNKHIAQENVETHILEQPFEECNDSKKAQHDQNTPVMDELVNETINEITIDKSSEMDTNHILEEGSNKDSDDNDKKINDINQEGNLLKTSDNNVGSVDSQYEQMEQPEYIPKKSSDSENQLLDIVEKKSKSLNIEESKEEISTCIIEETANDVEFEKIGVTTINETNDQIEKSVDSVEKHIAQENVETNTLEESFEKCSDCEEVGHNENTPIVDELVNKTINEITIDKNSTANTDHIKNLVMEVVVQNMEEGSNESLKKDLNLSNKDSNDNDKKIHDIIQEGNFLEIPDNNVGSVDSQYGQVDQLEEYIAAESSDGDRILSQNKLLDFVEEKSESPNIDESKKEISASFVEQESVDDFEENGVIPINESIQLEPTVTGNFKIDQIETSIDSIEKHIAQENVETKTLEESFEKCNDCEKVEHNENTLVVDELVNKTVNEITIDKNSDDHIKNLVMEVGVQNMEEGSNKPLKKDLNLSNKDSFDNSKNINVINHESNCLETHNNNVGSLASQYGQMEQPEQITNESSDGDNILSQNQLLDRKSEFPNIKESKEELSASFIEQEIANDFEEFQETGTITNESIPLKPANTANFEIDQIETSVNSVDKHITQENVEAHILNVQQDENIPVVDELVNTTDNEITVNKTSETNTDHNKSMIEVGVPNLEEGSTTESNDNGKKINDIDQENNFLETDNINAVSVQNGHMEQTEYNTKESSDRDSILNENLLLDFVEEKLEGPNIEESKEEISACFIEQETTSDFEELDENITPTTESIQLKPAMTENVEPQILEKDLEHCEESGRCIKKILSDTESSVPAVGDAEINEIKHLSSLSKGLEVQDTVEVASMRNKTDSVIAEENVQSGLTDYKTLIVSNPALEIKIMSSISEEHISTNIATEIETNTSLVCRLLTEENIEPQFERFVEKCKESDTKKSNLEVQNNKTLEDATFFDNYDVTKTEIIQSNDFPVEVRNEIATDSVDSQSTQENVKSQKLEKCNEEINCMEVQDLETVEDASIADTLIIDTTKNLTPDDIIQSDISHTDAETLFPTKIDNDLLPLYGDTTSIKGEDKEMTNVKSVAEQPTQDEQLLNHTPEECNEKGDDLEERTLEIIKDPPAMDKLLTSGTENDIICTDYSLPDTTGPSITNEEHTDSINKHTAEELICTNVSLPDTTGSSIINEQRTDTDPIKKDIAEEDLEAKNFEEFNVNRNSIENSDIEQDIKIIVETETSIPPNTNQEVTDNLFLNSKKDSSLKEIYQIETGVDSVDKHFGKANVEEPCEKVQADENMPVVDELENKIVDDITSDKTSETNADQIKNSMMNVAVQNLEEGSIESLKKEFNVSNKDSNDNDKKIHDIIQEGNIVGTHDNNVGSVDLQYQQIEQPEYITKESSDGDSIPSQNRLPDFIEEKLEYLNIDESKKDMSASFIEQKTANDFEEFEKSITPTNESIQLKPALTSTFDNPKTNGDEEEDRTNSKDVLNTSDEFIYFESYDMEDSIPLGVSEVEIEIGLPESKGHVFSSPIREDINGSLMIQPSDKICDMVSNKIAQLTCTVANDVPSNPENTDVPSITENTDELLETNDLQSKCVTENLPSEITESGNVSEFVEPSAEVNALDQANMNELLPNEDRRMNEDKLSMELKNLTSESDSTGAEGNLSKQSFEIHERQTRNGECTHFIINDLTIIPLNTVVDTERNSVDQTTIEKENNRWDELSICEIQIQPTVDSSSEISNNTFNGSGTNQETQSEENKCDSSNSAKQRNEIHELLQDVSFTDEYLEGTSSQIVNEQILHDQNSKCDIKSVRYEVNDQSGNNESDVTSKLHQVTNQGPEEFHQKPSEKFPQISSYQDVGKSIMYMKFSGDILKNSLEKIESETLFRTDNSMPGPIVQHLELSDNENTPLNVLATLASDAPRQDVGTIKKKKTGNKRKWKEGKKKRFNLKNKMRRTQKKPTTRRKPRRELITSVVTENKRVTRSAQLKSKIYPESKCKPHDFICNNSVVPASEDIYTQRLLDIGLTSEDSNHSEGNLVIDEKLHCYDEDTIEENLIFSAEPKVKGTVFLSIPDSDQGNFEFLAQIEQLDTYCPNNSTSKEIKIQEEQIANVSSVGENEHQIEAQSKSSEKDTCIIQFNKSTLEKTNQKPFRTKAEQKDYDKFCLKPYVSIERLNIINKEEKRKHQKTRSQSLDVGIFRRFRDEQVSNISNDEIRNLKNESEEIPPTQLEKITNNLQTESKDELNTSSAGTKSKNISCVGKENDDSDDDIPLSQRTQLEPIQTQKSTYKGKCTSEFKKQKSGKKVFNGQAKDCGKNKPKAASKKNNTEKKGNKVNDSLKDITTADDIPSPTISEIPASVTISSIDESVPLNVNIEDTSPVNVETKTEDLVKTKEEERVPQNVPQTYEEFVKNSNKKYYTTPKLRRKSESRHNLNLLNTKQCIFNANKKYYTPPKLRRKSIIESDVPPESYVPPHQGVPKQITLPTPNVDILANCKNTISPTTEKLKKKLETDFILHCIELTPKDNAVNEPLKTEDNIHPVSQEATNSDVTFSVKNDENKSISEQNIETISDEKLEVTAQAPERDLMESDKNVELEGKAIPESPGTLTAEVVEQVESIVPTTEIMQKQEQDILPHKMPDINNVVDESKTKSDQDIFATLQSGTRHSDTEINTNESNTLEADAFNCYKSEKLVENEDDKLDDLPLSERSALSQNAVLKPEDKGGINKKQQTLEIPSKIMTRRMSAQTSCIEENTLNKDKNIKISHTKLTKDLSENDLKSKNKTKAPNDKKGQNRLKQRIKNQNTSSDEYKLTGVCKKVVKGTNKKLKKHGQQLLKKTQEIVKNLVTTLNNSNILNETTNSNKENGEEIINEKSVLDLKQLAPNRNEKKHIKKDKKNKKSKVKEECEKGNGIQKKRPEKVLKTESKNNKKVEFFSQLEIGKRTNSTKDKKINSFDGLDNGTNSLKHTKNDNVSPKNKNLRKTNKFVNKATVNSQSRKSSLRKLNNLSKTNETIRISKKQNISKEDHEGVHETSVEKTIINNSTIKSSEILTPSNDTKNILSKHSFDEINISGKFETNAKPEVCHSTIVNENGSRILETGLIETSDAKTIQNDFPLKSPNNLTSVEATENVTTESHQSKHDATKTIKDNLETEVYAISKNGSDVDNKTLVSEELNSEHKDFKICDNIVESTEIINNLSNESGSEINDTVIEELNKDDKDIKNCDISKTSSKELRNCDRLAINNINTKHLESEMSQEEANTRHTEEIKKCDSGIKSTHREKSIELNEMLTRDVPCETVQQDVGPKHDKATENDEVPMTSSNLLIPNCEKTIDVDNLKEIVDCKNDQKRKEIRNGNILNLSKHDFSNFTKDHTEGDLTPSEQIALNVVENTSSDVATNILKEAKQCSLNKNKVKESEFHQEKNKSGNSEALFEHAELQNKDKSLTTQKTHSEKRKITKLENNVIDIKLKNIEDAFSKYMPAKSVNAETANKKRKIETVEESLCTKKKSETSEIKVDVYSSSDSNTANNKSPKMVSPLSISPRRKEKKGIEYIISQLKGDKINSTELSEELSKSDSSLETSSVNVDVHTLKKKLLKKMNGQSAEPLLKTANDKTLVIANLISRTKNILSKSDQELYRRKLSELKLKYSEAMKEAKNSCEIQSEKPNETNTDINTDKSTDFSKVSIENTMSEVNQLEVKDAQNNQRTFNKGKDMQTNKNKKNSFMSAKANKTNDIDENKEKPSSFEGNVDKTVIEENLEIENTSSLIASKTILEQSKIPEQVSVSTSSSVPSELCRRDTAVSIPSAGPSSQDNTKNLEEKHDDSFNLSSLEINSKKPSSINPCVEDFYRPVEDSNLVNLYDLILNVDNDVPHIEENVASEAVCILSDIISTTVCTGNNKLPCVTSASGLKFTFPITSQANMKNQYIPMSEVDTSRNVFDENRISRDKIPSTKDGSCLFPLNNQMDTNSGTLSSSSISLNLQDDHFIKLPMDGAQTFDLISSDNIIQTSNGSHFMDEIPGDNESSDVSEAACSNAIDHNYTLESPGGPLLSERSEEDQMFPITFDRNLVDSPGEFPLNDNQLPSELGGSDDTYKLNIHNEFAVKSLVMLGGQKADVNSFPLSSYHQIAYLESMKESIFSEDSNLEENINSLDPTGLGASIEQQSPNISCSSDPWTEYISSENPNEVIISQSEECIPSSFPISDNATIQPIPRFDEDALLKVSPDKETNPLNNLEGATTVPNTNVWTQFIASANPNNEAVPPTEQCLNSSNSISQNSTTQSIPIFDTMSKISSEKEVTQENDLDGSKPVSNEASTRTQFGVNDNPNEGITVSQNEQCLTTIPLPQNDIQSNTIPSTGVIRNETTHFEAEGSKANDKNWTKFITHDEVIAPQNIGLNLSLLGPQTDVEPAISNKIVEKTRSSELEISLVGEPSKVIPNDAKFWSQFITTEGVGKKVIVLPNEQYDTPIVPTSQNDITDSDLVSHNVENLDQLVKGQPDINKIGKETNVCVVKPSKVAVSKKSSRVKIEPIRTTILRRSKKSNVSGQKIVLANEDFPPSRKYSRTVVEAPPKKEMTTGGKSTGKNLSLPSMEVGQSDTTQSSEDKSPSLPKLDVPLVQSPHSTPGPSRNLVDIPTIVREDLKPVEIVPSSNSPSRKQSIDIPLTAQNPPEACSSTRSAIDVPKQVEIEVQKCQNENPSSNLPNLSKETIDNATKTSTDPPIKKSDITFNSAELVKSQKRAAAIKCANYNSPSPTREGKSTKSKKSERPSSRSRTNTPEVKATTDLEVERKIQDQKAVINTVPDKPVKADLPKFQSEKENKALNIEMKSGLEKDPLRNATGKSFVSTDNKPTAAVTAPCQINPSKYNYSIDSILSREPKYSSAQCINENLVKDYRPTRYQGVKRTLGTEDNGSQRKQMKIDYSEPRQLIATGDEKTQKKPSRPEGPESNHLKNTDATFDNLRQQGNVNELIRLRVTEDNKLKPERKNSPLLKPTKQSILDNKLTLNRNNQRKYYSRKETDRSSLLTKPYTNGFNETGSSRTDGRYKEQIDHRQLKSSYQYIDTDTAFDNLRKQGNVNELIILKEAEGNKLKTERKYSPSLKTSSKHNDIETKKRKDRSYYSRSKEQNDISKKEIERTDLVLKMQNKYKDIPGFDRKSWNDKSSPLTKLDGNSKGKEPGRTSSYAAHSRQSTSRSRSREDVRSDFHDRPHASHNYYRNQKERRSCYSDYNRRESYYSEHVRGREAHYSGYSGAREGHRSEHSRVEEHYFEHAPSTSRTSSSHTTTGRSSNVSGAYYKTYPHSVTPQSEGPTTQEDALISGPFVKKGTTLTEEKQMELLKALRDEVYNQLNSSGVKNGSAENDFTWFDKVKEFTDSKQFVPQDPSPPDDKK